MAVDVGKAVEAGIAVGATDAIYVAIGVRAVPHPARRSDINVRMLKVRSIEVLQIFFVILYYDCRK